MYDRSYFEQRGGISEADGAGDRVGGGSGAASACLQRQPDDGEDFVDLCGGIRRDLR